MLGWRLLGKALSLSHRQLSRYGDRCLSRQTADVVMLRGLSTIPYTYVDQERVVFQPDLTAAENKWHSNVEFYTSSSKRYHGSTPMRLILQQSFYMKLNHMTYYVIRNEPFLDNRDSAELFVKYGGQSIEGLVQSVLKHLPQKEDGQGYHNYFIRRVLEESETFKFRRVALERLVQVVQHKLDYFRRSWQPIQKKLIKRGNRVAFAWIAALSTQMIIVNWFVYFYLSWDIMEPITVLLANLELLIAYFFFIRNKKEFTLKKLTESAASHRLHDQMQREAFQYRKHEQLKQILEYLNFRLTLIDGSGQAIVGTLRGNLKLLDDR